MSNYQTLPPSNQIWYTSSDGCVIEPSSRYFSAVILGNEYTDWGVITFNRPITDICPNAFFESGRLVTIAFPMGVTEIGDAVCQGCGALEQVVVPDSVVKIGKCAFDLCPSLKSVTIPDSVEQIGDQAFGSNTELVRRAKATPATNEIWYTSKNGVALEFEPFSVAKIESNSYQNGLGVIKFDSDITVIEKNAFYDCKDIESIILPSGVKTIEPYAFSGCSSLLNIEIPASVSSIGACAFEGCLSLKMLTLDDNLTDIGEYAFACCKSLKSIVITDYITALSEGLFLGCDSLQSVTIGQMVKEVDSFVFENCRSLQNIYCKSVVPQFGADKLGLTMGMKLFVPHRAVDMYKIAEGWSAYAERISGYTPE